MKLIRFLITATLSISLLVALNIRLPLSNPIPPLGKFLNPFTGFWANSFEVNKEGALEITGLRDKVNVVYDSSAIAHIYASNEFDLYAAQGFITALDRLWQMEFQTHAAAGRVSEVLGAGKDSVYLSFDRDQRRSGMVFAAENFFKSLEEDSAMYNRAEAYAKGVNAYIATLNYKNLPLEYKLLDYQPEPWTILKTALLLKSMAKTLNTGEKDLEMTNALQLFGLETVNQLFPDYESVGDAIVENPGKWPKPVVIPDSIPLAVPQGLAEAIAQDKTDKDTGSNNWAVSGKKTASGYPILSNDPHLTLSLPSIWYTVHLSAPGYNSMGASLPGSPGIISGFNDSIAWGVTNAQRDAVDWYAIQFRDSTRAEYLHDGTWKKSVVKSEEYNVRGLGIFKEEVVYTHHGPIRFDKNFRAKNQRVNYAYRWISHDKSNEMRTFYQMNKGKNLSDYHSALAYFSAPAQNFIFASVAGDIAIRVQGKFPIRRKYEGKFVLDGSTSQTEWNHFIPDEHHARQDNPERGFVSSANQYPADSTYPYYINAASYEAYRNRRINRLLEAMDSISPMDMIGLQMDDHSLKGYEALPLLLNHLDAANLNEQEQTALNELKKWDFRYSLGSLGASYFESWWSALYPMVWDEFRGKQVELPMPTSYQTIRLIKTAPELKFYDVLETPEKETLKTIVLNSFKESVVSIEKWKEENKKSPAWADYKGTTVEHLTRLPSLSRTVAAPGNREAVNATSRRGGPSWRMVVSLEPNGIKAWGIYPGGQSGHPASKDYDNMIKPWSEGSMLSLQFSDASRLSARSSIKLSPQR